ncbi:Epimerase domain-containing protein [Agreia sp. COWG]|nr:Epimerase domain-containing protein [Agreia sp. COWG]
MTGAVVGGPCERILPVRIFLAGGSGVLGREVIPLLLSAGHEVVATTRSDAKTAALERSGASAVVIDALDEDATRRAVRRARPDAVLHLMTDLSTGDSASNAHLRSIGTRNLVEAAQLAGVTRMVAQSISWVYPAGTDAADEGESLDVDAREPRRTTVAAVGDLEEAVLSLPGGVVLRFGQLYGPATWYSRDGRFGADARAERLPATEAVASFIHIADAARAAVLALEWNRGVWNIVDDEPAPGREWAAEFAASVGAPPPEVLTSGDRGRPISNARARKNGLVLQHPSWRDGFRTL